VSLSPLVYGKVIGRYVAIIADTPADPDLDPDVLPMSGKVTITPSPSRLLVATAVPAPATVIPTPVVVTLDDEGYLSHNGDRGVYVIASDDPSTNPTAFTYRVSFDLQLGNVKVPCPSFDIEVPAGGVVDLTKDAPVPASPGSGIVRGPEGELTDVTIGTVSTLASGEPATATITGDAPTKQLNLGLPRGGIGEKGDKGDPGDVTAATGINPASGTIAIPALVPATYRYAVSDALAFTLAAGMAGKSYSITLVVSMTVARVITWPVGVLWPEGVKPTNLPAGRHVFNLLWDGFTWQGALVGLNYA
jgi:hypothetical protein